MSKENALQETEQYPIHKTLTETIPAPLVDDVAGVQFIGFASLGVKTSQAFWKILKISVSGTLTTTEYADGDMKYNNIWDDRLTLKYSR